MGLDHLDLPAASASQGPRGEEAKVDPIEVRGVRPPVARIADRASSACRAPSPTRKGPLPIARPSSDSRSHPSRDSRDSWPAARAAAGRTRREAAPTGETRAQYDPDRLRLDGAHATDREMEFVRQRDARGAPVRELEVPRCDRYPVAPASLRTDAVGRACTAVSSCTSTPETRSAACAREAGPRRAPVRIATEVRCTARLSSTLRHPGSRGAARRRPCRRASASARARRRPPRRRRRRRPRALTRASDDPSHQEPPSPRPPAWSDLPHVKLRRRSRLRTQVRRRLRTPAPSPTRAPRRRRRAAARCRADRRDDVARLRVEPRHGRSSWFATQTPPSPTATSTGPSPTSNVVERRGWPRPAIATASPCRRRSSRPTARRRRRRSLSETRPTVIGSRSCVDSGSTPTTWLPARFTIQSAPSPKATSANSLQRRARRRARRPPRGRCSRRSSRPD